MFKKINTILSRDEKKFLIGLVFFSIFVSLIETFAVSILMPFISAASSFKFVEDNQYMMAVYQFFNLNSPIQFVVIFGVFLFFFYIFRSIMNIFYYYMLSRFSEGRYFSISRQLFKKYLSLDYQKFNSLNTAHLTKIIINEASYFTQVISSLLVMISEVFVIIFIYVLLLYVDWKSTFFLSIVLVLVVGLLLRKITKLIKTKGREREVYQRKIYDVLSASFGNYKVIKLFSNKDNVVDNFTNVSKKLVHSNIVFETSSHIPRLLLDALGFASLSLLITFLVWRYNADISLFMPVLSLYILALYRLLPSVHRIIVRYNKIMYYSQAIELVHRELEYKNENLGNENIVFQNKILFDDVSFSYTNNENILENINLIIKRGDSIGIVGESGSGKSTFVDMLLGLNLPGSGTVMIDDQQLSMNNLVSWRKQIGYIPQKIYLFDGSVGDNIVFGREYDEGRLVKVLQKVKLWELFVNKEGINTEVGEGGKLLSGGQQQRVAIARALYGEPDILILDEATSSLDAKIEMDIMNEIYNLTEKKTLIIISHNENILKKCDIVYKVEYKTLTPYKEV